jgi:hypothetical protein
LRVGEWWWRPLIHARAAPGGEALPLAALLHYTFHGERAAGGPAVEIKELGSFLSYFGALGAGGLVGAGVLYFLLKSFLPSYFAEKAKNLATKEDIARITRQVEGVKAEFAIQLQEIQYQKSLLTEGFKNTLSKQQEYDRSANAAVVDLTKKLATGSHFISWLSWNATQPGYSFSANDFKTYERQMVAVLSDLVGLQASVASLDTAKFEALSPFAEEIYTRDIMVGEAKAIVLNARTPDLAQGIQSLRDIYAASLDFDKRLLAKVQNLLHP